MDLGLTRVDLLQVGLTYPKCTKLLPNVSPSEKAQQKVYHRMVKWIPDFKNSSQDYIQVNELGDWLCHLCHLCKVDVLIIKVQE